MKTFLLSLFFLLNTIGFSQNFSVQVVYKVKDVTSYVDMGKLPVNTKNTLLAIIKAAEEQTFVLTFSSNQSSYVAETLLSKGESAFYYSLAKAQFTGLFDYYYDFNDKVAILKGNTESILLKKNYTPLNWKVTTESKNIDGYLCYKANFEIPYKNSYNEDRVKRGYVWFTPSLPFAIGPKEYVGLPGLVVELHEENVVFYADKINLKSTKKVVFPKGKTITNDDFEKKLKTQIGM